MLDVDSGRVTPVAGIPKLQRGVVWVVAVGGRGGGVAADSFAATRIYVVDGGGRARYVGGGRHVVPAVGGKSVWVQSVVAPSRCTLRRVGLDGRLLRSPRAFPCATTSDPTGGSLGLVVRRTRIVDPRTGRTVLTARWGIVAASGNRLVLAGPGRAFTLMDATTREQRRLPWPSILHSRDDPAVDPRGGLIALAFAHPAWEGGPQQALDLWLLDTATAELTQLPAMPALVSLKRTSMDWTDDGRLVLLGESDGKNFVAVWRPGEERLAIKTVQLPERTSGSDSFAVLG